jgi:hypothetical protein
MEIETNTQPSEIALDQSHPALEPGDIVAHFKRETVPAEEIAAGSTRYLYRYLGVVHHSETQEPLALYEALYPPFGMWVRPLDMFLGKVDREKYPAIRQRWRFERADSSASSGACGGSEARS